MSQGIADGAEAPLQQHREAFVFRLLCFRLQRIDCQHWIVDGKDSIHQRGTVTLNTGQFSHSLCKALGSLKDGVEVVFLQQFNPAILQHFHVDLAALELRMQRVQSTFGLIQRFCNGAVPTLAIRPQFQTGE